MRCFARTAIQRGIDPMLSEQRKESTLVLFRDMRRARDVEEDHLIRVGFRVRWYATFDVSESAGQWYWTLVDATGLSDRHHLLL
ncbi:hypothetical protein [Paraburkholderia sp. SIMBA_030]|uniref:hypothetical protein n=1 Tax=Paraburkholderia sp. SIMBA_030 TaxID=3085773 RepID=UPI00397E4DAD